MPWYENWFGTPYYKLLYRHRDESDARPWVQSILSETGLGKGARVLDLACGRGRHARWFSQAGLCVTGVDISEESIKEARAAVPEADFLVHDIRVPLRTGPFDLAVCLFTSIGYFDRPSDDQRVLESVTSALVPGGWFVLDLMNAERVSGKLVPSEQLEIEGVRFHVARRLEDGVVVKRIQVSDVGEEHLFEERVRAIAPEEVRAMMERAGLQVMRQTDGPEPLPFDADRSERCVTWARKPV
ncbi:MAG: class I SAM-dependent methyltransferase [Flavobacteriales bacterium]|nr:class I SAM-dependent methyltransferase [Flavobacteriales bacterium]